MEIKSKTSLTAAFMKSVVVFSLRFSRWEKNPSDAAKGILVSADKISEEIWSAADELEIPATAAVWLLIMNACLAHTGMYGVSDDGDLTLVSKFKGEQHILDEEFLG